MTAPAHTEEAAYEPQQSFTMSSPTWTVKSFLATIGVDESDVDSAASKLLGAGFKTEKYLLCASRESLQAAGVALPVIDVILDHQGKEGGSKCWKLNPLY